MLAFRVAAKKLHPYFQAHPFIVLTNLPLRSTIHKPNLSRMMARWAIKLSVFGIQYKPCLAIKGQILAHFLVEIPQQDLDSGNVDWWILSMDSASRQTGASVSLQLKAPTRERIKQAIRLEILASNNEVEYEAILAGIDLTISVSSEKTIIQSDSQLVVGQVNEEYKTQDKRMTKYVCLDKLQLESFVSWKLEHIPRVSNEKANALATVVSSLLTKEIVLLTVYYQLMSSIAAN